MQSELVERARHGDREAYEALARASAPRLLGVCHRILRDLGRAEDALQLTMLAIWTRLPGLREPERFEAWSYRIAVNESIAIARRDRAMHRTVPLLESDGIARDESGGIGDRDALEQAFLHLSPEHRAVVVLRFYVGLTLDEIAGVMGTPPGTAASRLHYALAALRRDLDPEDVPLAAEGALA